MRINIRGIFTGLLLSVAAMAQAQEVRVLGSDKKPIEVAHIIVKTLRANATDEVLLVNTKGIAQLPTDANRYPCSIVVAALGYERIMDTLRTPADKTYYLKAQQQTINEIVITGQYAPNSPEKAVQKIDIIDRKKIDAMAAQNLRDVLTNQMNVRLSQDNILGSSMSLQGIDGQNVKILVDGVPMIGRQNGSIDLSQINMYNVERIEIISGPMAVNYGTDALAGTINIMTKKSQANTFEGSATGYYETIGTYNANARLGFHKKNHTVIATGTRNFFAGWNPGNDITFFDFKAKKADSSRQMQWKPRTQYIGDLQYIYTLGKTTFNYKGTYFNETIVNRGLPNYFIVANDDYYHTDRIDNALFINSKVSKNNSISFLAAYNNYKRIRNTYINDLTTLEENLSTAAGMQDTSTFNQFNSRGTYSNGNKDVKLNYEAGYDINIQNARGTQIVNNKQAMGDYAAYASAEYKPITSLTIRPGLRYSYNTAYDAPLIPSLHLLYKPDNHLAVRASYSRGFRAPTLKELYFYFVDVNHNIKGNTNLKAECSNNYIANASYSRTYKSLIYKVELGGFLNDITNRITLAQVVSSTTNEYTYTNIGTYKTHGGQANMEIGYKHLKFAIGAIRTGLYNEYSEVTNVPKYIYYTEFRSNVYYDIRKLDMNVALFYKYTGRMPGYFADATGAVNLGYVNAFNTADVTVAKYFFAKTLNVSVGCKNLFDVTNIASTIGSSGTAHSSATGSQSIANGRFYFVKLDYFFKSK